MTQREHLQKIFIKLLESEIEILQFQKSISKSQKDKDGLRKMINHGRKAIKTICDLKHTEILVSLYNSFISQKETYFVMIEKTINSKKTKYWDTTKKGFQEFLKLELQAKAQSDKEIEERKKQQEIIAKAKADGKKIEMVFENGKLKPVIVEDNKA